MFFFATSKHTRILFMILLIVECTFLEKQSKDGGNNEAQDYRDTK